MSLYPLLLSLAIAGAPPDAPATTPTSEEVATDADAAPASERGEEIDAAEALLKAGEIAAAREKLTQAQAKNPRLPDAGVVLARWYLANNQLAAARSELEHVVETQPGDPEPYALLGELAWRDRRIAETDLLFREALARAEALSSSPERRAEAEVQAQAGLATVAEARKQWSTARDHLTAWIKLEEKNPNAHQRLGLALFHLGKAKEALAEYQTAARFKPDLVPEIELGRLYTEAGNRDSAAKLMSAAAKRLPDNLAVRMAVANWFLQENRLAEAKQQVAAALKIDPAGLDAQILAGGIARLEGDNAAAERYLTTAHEQAPDNFSASNLLALTLADQDGQAPRERALELAQQNFDKYPGNSEAIATLGWTLFRLQRWEDAERELRDALGTGTLNADGAYFVAKMLERAGQIDDAKILLTKALATDRLFAYQKPAKALLARLEAPPAKTPAAKAPDTKASANTKTPAGAPKPAAKKPR